jgi:hypothetical protein
MENEKDRVPSIIFQKFVWSTEIFISAHNKKLKD